MDEEEMKKLNLPELLEKYGDMENKARLPMEHFDYEAKVIAPKIKVSESNFWFRTILPVLKTLDIKRGVALDAGCGFGQNTIPLTDYFSDVRGIDFCRYKISWARNNFFGPKIEFQVHNLADKFPFQNVDYVQTITVLQHINIKDKCAVLLNIYSCLTENGVALLGEGRVVNRMEEDEKSKKQKHMFSTPLGLLKDVFDSVENANGIWVCKKS